jgi:hypothetical protein
VKSTVSEAEETSEEEVYAKNAEEVEQKRARECGDEDVEVPVAPVPERAEYEKTGEKQMRESNEFERKKKRVTSKRSSRGCTKE